MPLPFPKSGNAVSGCRLVLEFPLCVTCERGQSCPRRAHGLLFMFLNVSLAFLCWFQVRPAPCTRTPLSPHPVSKSRSSATAGLSSGGPGRGMGLFLFPTGAMCQGSSYPCEKYKHLSSSLFLSLGSSGDLASTWTLLFGLELDFGNLCLCSFCLF